MRNKNGGGGGGVFATGAWPRLSRPPLASEWFLELCALLCPRGLVLSASQSASWCTVDAETRFQDASVPRWLLRKRFLHGLGTEKHCKTSIFHMFLILVWNRIFRKTWSSLEPLASLLSVLGVAVDTLCASSARGARPTRLQRAAWTPQESPKRPARGHLGAPFGHPAPSKNLNACRHSSLGPNKT